jgi:hypothetical protein
MKLSRLFLSSVLALFVAHASAQNGSFTDWMKSSKLTELLQQMDEDRMFPGTVEGRVSGQSIQYRAQFIPFLQDMDYFQSRWGMTAKWYKWNTEELTKAGFREFSHTTFTDASGSILHQATWVLVSGEHN